MLTLRPGPNRYDGGPYGFHDRRNHQPTDRGARTCPSPLPNPPPPSRLPSLAEPVPPSSTPSSPSSRPPSPADRRDALLAFAKMFLRRLSDEDLESLGPSSSCSAGCDRPSPSSTAAATTRRASGSSCRRSRPTATSSPAPSIETSTDDSPFLVDSVTEELSARDLHARLLLHPMIGTRRAEDGRVERVLAGRDAAHRESVIHIELERRLNEQDRADLEGRLRAILHDVRLVIRDFEPMEERVRHMGELARAGVGRLLPAGGRRDGRLHRLAPPAELRVPRVPRVPARRRTRRAHDPGGPGLRARDLVRRLDELVRRRDAARHARPGGPPPDRGGRAPRHHEDQGLRDRAPARADGLRRACGS